MADHWLATFVAGYLVGRISSDDFVTVVDSGILHNVRLQADQLEVLRLTAGDETRPVTIYITGSAGVELETSE